MEEVARQILQAAGIEPTYAQPWQFDLATQSAKAYYSGQLPSFEDAVRYFKAGSSGQQYIPGVGSRAPTPVASGETAPTQEAPLDIPSLVRILTPLYGVEGALLFIQSNPSQAYAVAMKLLGDDGGGGGGRTEFASESRLRNAQAAQLEQQLALMGQGSSRLQSIGGFLFDPATGEVIDPSQAGLGRYSAETERKLAEFRMGPEFGEAQRQFDARFGLDTAAESRLNASAQADAAVNFGKLGVDRANFERQVLSNPADALYRLAAQRGGTSPTDRITMADILNAFRQQPSNISGAVQSRFTPAAPLAARPSPVVPPKVVNPTTPTAPPGSFTPGTLGEQLPAYTPGALSGTTNAPGGSASVNWSDGSSHTYDPALTGAPVDPGTYDAIEQNANDMFQPDASGQDFRFEVNNEGTLVATPMAQGGYTRESRFIVGDQRSGKPTGHEELVVNPTNAPIAVVPNKALKGTSRFTGPRYDEGTASYGDNRPKVAEVAPTGGFLNSLRETLSGLGDWQAGNREAISNGPLGEISKILTGTTDNPIYNRALGDAQMVAPVFKGPFLESTRFDLTKIPTNWGPKELHRFSNDIKMTNLQNIKKMQDAAIERASRLDTMAAEAVGPAKSRLSKLAERAYARLDPLYEYEQKLQDEMMRSISSAGTTQIPAGRSLSHSLQEALKPATQVNLPSIEQLDLQLRAAVKAHKDAVRGYDELQQLGVKGLLSGEEAGKRLSDAFAKVKTAEDAKNKIFELIQQVQGSTPRYADGTGLFDTYGSSLFPTQQFTQSGIIDMARQATSPGGASVLSGQMPSRFRIPGLQTPTAMQFNSLSSAEKENLRPRLAAEFDSTLEDLMFDIEQRYSTGPSRMAKFRG